MARTPLAQQKIRELLAAHHVLSAVTIVQLLQTAGMNVNKTTVYRALDKMLADKEVCRHSLESDTLLYELREHHHDHVVCEVCGNIEQTECAQHLQVRLPSGF